MNQDEQDHEVAAFHQELQMSIMGMNTEVIEKGLALLLAQLHVSWENSLGKEEADMRLELVLEYAKAYREAWDNLDGQG